MSALNNFNRVLTWADFVPVEPPPVDSGEGATIGVTWEEEHEPGRKGNVIYIKSITVNIVMPDQTMNTVVKTKKSDAMLKHEQGHYDIIALGAREFYKKAQQLEAASDTRLNEMVDALFTEIKDKADVVDARYDSKTDHHLNKDVQATWDKAIETAKKSKSGTVDNLPD